MPDELKDISDRIAALEIRDTQLEAQLRLHDKRISDIEKMQTGIIDIRLMIERLSMGNDQLQKSVESLVARLEKLDAKVGQRMDSLEKRFDAHEKAPAEKWDKASWLIITLIIGGIVGWIINTVIPK